MYSFRVDVTQKLREHCCIKAPPDEDRDAKGGRSSVGVVLMAGDGEGTWLSRSMERASSLAGVLAIAVTTRVLGTSVC